MITDFEWPLPSDGRPGAWVEAAGVEPCRSGIHATDADHLSYWLSDRLWVIELEAPVETARHKIVARRGRLLRPVPAWHERISEEFAADVAWRSRDRVLDALAGSPETSRSLADGLASARSLSDLAALDSGGGESEGEGHDLHTAALLVADCAADALEGSTASAGFEAACVAGHLAGPTREAKDAYEAAFHAERVRQSRWIAARVS